MQLNTANDLMQLGTETVNAQGDDIPIIVVDANGVELEISSAAYVEARGAIVIEVA